MKSHENISNDFFNAIKAQAVFSDIYSFFDFAIAPEKPLVIAEENSRLKIKSLDDIDSVPSYAYLLAYNYIAANLTSHFLLHGVALSWNVERAASPLNQQAAGSTVESGLPAR